MVPAERRKYRRFNTLLPARVRAFWGQQKKVRGGTCRNLCFGGALLLMEQPLAEGMVVVVAINFESQVGFACEAIVKRCEKSAEENCYRIALSFLDIDYDARQLIQRYAQGSQTGFILTRSSSIARLRDLHRSVLSFQ